MWYIVISLSNSPFFIIYIFELDLLWDYLFSFRGSLLYFWNYRKGEWDCQKLETSGRYMKFSLTFIENYVVTTVCGLYNTPVATISASSVRSHTHTHTPPSPTGPRKPKERICGRYRSTCLHYTWICCMLMAAVVSFDVIERVKSKTTLYWFDPWASCWLQIVTCW